MAMAVDSRQQHHLGGGMGYDTMRYSQPQFNNPWGATSGSPPNHMYHPTSSAVDHKPQVMSMGYVANPAASSLGSDLVPTRSYGTSTYGTSAPMNQASYAPTSIPRYSPEQGHSVSPYGYESDISRRSSYGQPAAAGGRASFDEMAGARGMIAMAGGHDVTPRPIVTNGRESSQDSYGFPTTHSPHGSVSSASTYPYYSGGSSYGSYAGSVDGSSVTDYSSASEDAMGPRTLPGTSQMINGFPPEPASMMTQFNSKMSPSASKKHKCRICDKRFTRPSSLQTHMYSHTGEKPFACDVEGCGRHFSVVSNLRRHKKVHKNDSRDDVEEE